VPINASTSGATPIVTTNYKRNFILIQNNSTATTPDTTPIFYVTFDSPLQGAAGLALAVPALSGIVLDAVVPSNAIYITLGTYSNGGGTANVAGVLIQGTMLPAG
jgi:hypothetical protein